MSVAHLRGFKRIYNHYTANKKASAKMTDAFYINCIQVAISCN